MSQKLLRPLLFFLVILLALQFFSKPEDQPESQDDIVLETEAEISAGKEIILGIRNNTDRPLSFPEGCPEKHLSLEKYVNGEWIAVEEGQIQCTQPEQVALEPDQVYQVSYGQKGWQLFDEEGRYRISLMINLDEKEKVYSREVEIIPPGFFRNLWQEVFHKPILNILIFLVSSLPGYSLGWAVILLTLLIKVILLAPNHKALKSQKAMQKLQPRLEAIKLKYKDNQPMLAQETMRLWREHKVSPLGSCLPLLIQFPILIGLFYVVRDGLGAIHPDLLYGSLKNFDPALIDPYFLNLIDLTKINLIALPLIVGGLQFIQMKLALGKNKHQSQPASPMAGMTQTMVYIMPLMIAVFTATLPAAVGLYWGTSTLFGIGQQMVVNRSK